jgi:lipopolysaccharide/colanic/teichoic acid biosynthesis glycosyltransferase
MDRRSREHRGCLQQDSGYSMRTRTPQTTRGTAPPTPIRRRVSAPVPVRARPIAPRPPAVRALAAKHALDRTVAALLILVMLPVLVALAAAVKLTSSGPVLYRQRRIGRDGRSFEILKFRSMGLPGAVDRFRPLTGNAPGGIEGDDRRTEVGKIMRRTSLDELPQLFNVLKGDMSLVGPRPERPEFVQLFADEVPGYASRHRMQVGITGLAQVRGLRGQTSIAMRAASDNEYIEQWSLWLDVKVLVRTAFAVLQPAE